MNQKNRVENVVELGQRSGRVEQPRGDQQIGGLIKSLRNLTIKQINISLQSLFENIDDALFDMAEKAETNHVQTEFFDGMREVRKKRSRVQREYQNLLSKQFTSFGQGKLHEEQAEPTYDGEGGLALVDDQELEQSLAISNMVSKADNRLSRPLFELGQRLVVVSGGGKVDNESNPASPIRICEAFQEAANEFDLEIHVRLIIFKLFEKYVMAALPRLYDDLNATLIEAGVLPQLKPRVGNRRQQPRSAHTVTPQREESAADTVTATTCVEPQAPDTYYAGSAPESEIESQLYRTVSELLTRRRHQSGEGAARLPEESVIQTDGAAAPSHYDQTVLLNALSILQGELTHSRTLRTASPIKHELLEQVKRLTDVTESHQVTGADEDTIDLVGMLFEFIVQDRNLPDAIQALLSRLQIPFLKAAIIDRHLLAQKRHPARELLDEMADLGKRWSAKEDRGNRVYDKLRDTVETVLDDFDEDLSVFEHLRDDLRQFKHKAKRQSDAAERRTTEATKGREKLLSARQSTALLIKKVIAKQASKPPTIIYSLLTRPWANVMVLTLLRHGERSDPWKNVVRVAKDLAWSGNSMESDRDRNRLRHLVPILERAIRRGLTLVAYHEDDIETRVGELAEYYKQQLMIDDKAHKSAEPSAKTAAPAADEDDSATPGEPSFVEEIVLESETDNKSQSEWDNDEHVKTLRSIKTGTWFEFAHEKHSPIRAKLSWISPISGKFLFVNRKGLKVADKTIFGLATEMRSGSVSILADVPLVDRAMDAIITRLKTPSEATDPEVK